MKLFSQKLSFARGILGLSQEEDGVAVAHVLRQGDAEPRLTACDFLPGRGEEQANVLREWLKEKGLAGSRSVFALAPELYQLLQVAPPEVPDGELRDAVRWQIRDLIDFPLEEAVVDVFQVPRDVQREGARTAYVVVARQSHLRQRVALLQGLKVKLQAIDIPELVLRNIGNLLPDADKGVALLYFGSDSGRIVICRGGKLCLARNINIGAEALRPDSAYRRDMIDAVALEIQRSLDFFESNFAQPAITSLVLTPLEFDATDLLVDLQGALGLTIRPLEIAELFECANEPEQPQRCLLAIGAALRNDMVSS